MNYEKIKNTIITISIMILIILIIIISYKQKQNNLSKITHQDIEIKTTKALQPYIYYKIYLYISEEDEWEPDTVYYNFLENPDDSFFGKTIYIEDEKLDSSIFKNYTVLAFAKNNNYSFTLDSYYLSDSFELELTLNEYAICEDFYNKSPKAFGGIFMIPKDQQIEDISFFINEKTDNNTYIIHKDSENSPFNYYRNYSEKLLTENIIKTYNFNSLGDFYTKLITSKEELKKLSEELEIIDYIDLLDSSYPNLFLYRNILLCARNSNGEFYCEPQVTKDFYCQDVWSKNLKIKEYIYETSQKDYVTYYSLIPLPKIISLQNVCIEKQEKIYKNFEDTELKIKFKDAEKIAQNYFNTISSLSANSSLEIVDLNKIKNSISNSKESIENPNYKRLWFFRDEYFNIIYIDACTGEIIIK